MRALLVLAAICLLACRAHSVSVELDTMVINGRTALWGEFPWQVSFELRNFDTSGSEGHFCGAVLLSDRWALTAAACLRYAPPSNRLLGNVITRTVDRLTTGILVNITAHYGHPEYDSNSFNPAYPNDIALLEFEDPIESYDTQFAPISLPATADDNFVGSECTFSGWGTTERDNPYSYSPSDTLLASSTSVITNEDCETRIGISGYHVGPDHICIFNGGSNPCSYDNGGPMSCKDATGQWVVVGITSWGIIQFDGSRYSCAVSFPYVGTRVSHYLDWISATTNGALPLH